MISTARFRDAAGVQQSHRGWHTLDADPGPSDNPRPEAAAQQQRSFPPNPAFSFDFRLESDVLGGVKPTEQVARQEVPLDFSLSAFPEPPRNYSPHSYEPPPLDIPPQPHSGTHSPSTYVHSSASTLTSQPFSDFPPLSDSRSLSHSPLDRPSWTEHSSSPHDAPQNGAPDLAFDSRLAHIPFPMSLQSSQRPILPGLPHARLPDPQSGAANGHSSPESGSHDSPDMTRSKIGPNGLAEDQPPTAQGKMRTRVYVACLQCRSRKIRCDGGKPKCLKCTRRSSECQYDSAPKRRGPDKKPGARQRTSKKAKAAKEEATKSRDADTWGHHIIKVSDDDEGEPSGDRKRRKAGDGFLSWPVDGGGGEQGRSSSVATASPVEVPPPVRSRGPQGLPAAFGVLSDLSDGVRDDEKPDAHLFNDFVGSGSQQPTSHGRLHFSYDLNTGGARVSDPPPILANSQQDYIHPASSIGVSYFSHAHIQSLDEEEQGEDQNHRRKWSEIGSEPSLEFSRKTWWDSLLAMYSPSSDRAKTTLEIHGDLQFLFRTSNYLFSYFNVPLFFSIFCNPAERDKMQPSLVLAGLAMATFMRSSEINLGNAGRMRALWLRDAAQSALEASYNARWIEPTLAQAAFLLALFEVCAHPHHSSERSSSSMVLLDSIIRALGLTSIDAGDPTASVFSPRGVPTVSGLAAPRTARTEGCACTALTLAHNSRSSQTHTPLWAATAAWGPEWTVAEIRKEESRRLCWSTLQLAAGHTAAAAAFALPTLDFYCVQPANYALLFPGESLAQAAPFHGAAHAGKDTVWALYSRAMLLWNSCLRMRADDVTNEERATFAVGAWIESTAIEEALDRHTCGCDQAFMYQGREFLFITRMCISYEFRRYIPHPESDVNGLFNRKKAMAWLVRQSGVAKRIMHGLHTVTGHKDNTLAQRPFFVFWFMSLIARSLVLFSCDQSLLIAIEVCQSFLPPIEYLSCLWPCAAQRTRYRTLHARVIQACNTAGVAPPPPPNFDILAPGSPPMKVI